MRHTKIVATIGPATRDEAMLEGLIRAGMSVARLNLSHGDQQTHAADFRRIRSVSERLGVAVAVMADLQGPKIRVGRIEGGSIPLAVGDDLVITTRDVVGGPGIVPTTYDMLPHDVKPGDHILLADGELELLVVSCTHTDVSCKVLVGGVLGQNKGINLPGIAVSTPALTEKDRSDLAFALDLGVDWVALSFVRRPADVIDLRRAMRDHGHQALVVAKIEKREAVEAIDQILRVSDAIMIARGDLGVELPLEDVPVLQKRLIRLAHQRSVPAIVATQMLQSMVGAPRPTRAEASDVANAIFDNADAVMLSGETAVGNYPVEAVQVMDRIARTAESAALARRPYVTGLSYSTSPHANTIAHSACRVAHDLRARGIIVFSHSGATARLVSMYRPAHPVVAVTPLEESWRRMALYWGIHPMLAPNVTSGAEMVPLVEEAARLLPGCRPGDACIVTSGTSVGDASVTNSLRIQLVSVYGPAAAADAHAAAEPDAPVRIDPVACIACGECVAACARGVLEIVGDVARVVEGRGKWCDRNGACVADCPTGAVSLAPVLGQGSA